MDDPLDISTELFTFDEIKTAASQLKSGRASGMDRIPPDILKIPEILQFLLPIIHDVHTLGKPPKEFVTNKLIILPKKGDLTKRGSYRGMSCVANLYNRMLLVSETQLNLFDERIRTASDLPDRHSRYYLNKEGQIIVRNLCGLLQSV